MLSTYQEYLNQIQNDVQVISSDKLLFWGAWICSDLYRRCELDIENYLTKKEHKVVVDSLIYLCGIIDHKIESDQSIVSRLFKSLQDFDETNLDQTDYIENTIYQLIISLDGILDYLFTGVRGFEYNMSQAIINVIDVQLQDRNIDILSKEGFDDDAMQKEITAQFSMIELLRTTSKIDSSYKNKFREK